MFVQKLLSGRACIAATFVVLSFPLVHAVPAAQADEKITYLFPAPPLLPAFGPIQLAKGKGYFAQAGLDVSYAVGRGGVDVAKEVGAGNVPIGGFVADAPIIVRQNGVPVEMVDERLTSWEAERLLEEQAGRISRKTTERGAKKKKIEGKNSVDAVAAAVILNDYLKQKHPAGESI